MSKIEYLNTDLDIIYPNIYNISRLVDAFNKNDIFALSDPFKLNDKHLMVSFELNHNYSEPKQTISRILSAIESFDSTCKDIWNGCEVREFSIGYNCGEEPWAFNNVLSTELLKRIVSANTTLKITIYPAEKE